jgi:hypothetical protein
MGDFVAKPVERTLDSRENRREPRPKRGKQASEREPTASAHFPVTPGVTEDEAHTLDIEA